jgi:hypothetical protein
MSLEEARRVIRDDAADHVDWVCATRAISSTSEVSSEIFRDLVVCLSRRGGCIGMSVLALYSKSKRDYPLNGSEVSRSSEEWAEYLTVQGLI